MPCIFVTNCLFVCFESSREGFPVAPQLGGHQQSQPPMSAMFSPAPTRAADGFAAKQQSIGHHYRSVPPTATETTTTTYYQPKRQQTDGSQSWNEWNQQLTVIGVSFLHFDL